MVYYFITADDISVFEDEIEIPIALKKYRLDAVNNELMDFIVANCPTVTLCENGYYPLLCYEIFLCTEHTSFEQKNKELMLVTTAEQLKDCLTMNHLGTETLNAFLSQQLDARLYVECYQEEVNLILFTDTTTKFVSYIQQESDDIHSHGPLDFTIATNIKEFERLLMKLTEKGFNIELLKIDISYVEGKILSENDIVRVLDKIHLEMDYSLVEKYKGLNAELINEHGFSKAFLYEFLYFLENNGRYYTA